MADRSATALLGMDGFVVLSHTEEDGELWLLVETTDDVVGCPMRIPTVFVHLFRRIPYTHSGRFRTPRRRLLGVRA
jgi:hypothetical protein